LGPAPRGLGEHPGNEFTGKPVFLGGVASLHTRLQFGLQWRRGLTDSQNDFFPGVPDQNLSATDQTEVRDTCPRFTEQRRRPINWAKLGNEFGRHQHDAQSPRLFSRFVISQFSSRVCLSYVKFTSAPFFHSAYEGKCLFLSMAVFRRPAGCFSIAFLPPSKKIAPCIPDLPSGRRPASDHTRLRIIRPPTGRPHAASAAPTLARAPPADLEQVVADVLGTRTFPACGGAWRRKSHVQGAKARRPSPLSGGASRNRGTISRSAATAPGPE